MDKTETQNGHTSDTSLDLNAWVSQQGQGRQDNNAPMQAQTMKLTACGMTLDDILDTPMDTLRATKSYDELSEILAVLQREIDIAAKAYLAKA